MDVETVFIVFPWIAIAGVGCCLRGLCFLFVDLMHPGYIRSQAMLLKKGEVDTLNARIGFADQLGIEHIVVIQFNFRAWSRYKLKDEIPILYLRDQPRTVELRQHALRIRGPLCVTIGALAAGGAILLLLGLGSTVGALMNQ